MNSAAKAALAAVAVAGLAGGGFAVFEHSERQGVVEKGERVCGSLDTPHVNEALPSTLQLPSDEKLLEIAHQGKTTLVVASTGGTRQDVVEVRDAVVRALTAEGYRKTGDDAEPGYEAEAQLEGTADASVKVRPLCEGRLEVRYALRG